MNVNLITMGNHTFGNNDIFELLEDSKNNIIIPANYEDAKENGYKIINYNNTKVLVINLLGRSFMDPNVSNPFLVCDSIIKNNPADYIFVDFHAEATSEKLAFASYFDGTVDAVIGTHTHVQTADERMLNKGLLFLSDVGMTGPYDGILGVDKDLVIDKFLYGHTKNKKLADGKRQLSACLIDFVKKEIKRIHIHE